LIDPTKSENQKKTSKNYANTLIALESS
jgi:hypothetical protein